MKESRQDMTIKLNEMREEETKCVDETAGKETRKGQMRQ